MQYLAGRGIRYVRVAFRQERLQPTFLGPLNPDGVAEVRHVLDDAGTASLSVNVDWHNYARFYVGAREVVLGTPQYPISYFVDFHAKVAAEFKGDPALYALSLTNEPHDLRRHRATSRPGQRFHLGDRFAQEPLAGRQAGYQGWYSVGADKLVERVGPSAEPSPGDGG